MAKTKGNGKSSSRKGSDNDKSGSKKDKRKFRTVAKKAIARKMFCRPPRPPRFVRFDTPREQDGEYRVNTTEPNLSFGDLAGVDKIKTELQQLVIGPFAHPEMAKLVDIEPPRGILLTGPPGTGKSALAEAIANELNELGVDVSFYVETGACLNKWVGESESNLRRLFAEASENAPSVIFLDEIDGLGRRRQVERDGGNNTILTTLLTEMNKLERGKVLVIGATNCPEAVDKALIRRGRFDMRYDLEAPDGPSRKQILALHLDKKNLKVSNAQLQGMVEQTAGFVGSDLGELVRRIHLNAVQRVFPENSLFQGDLSQREVKKLVPKVQQVRGNDIHEALKVLAPEVNGKGGNNDSDDEDSDSDFDDDD